jgi:putative DNA primase/helicase
LPDLNAALGQRGGGEMSTTSATSRNGTHKQESADPPTLIAALEALEASLWPVAITSLGDSTTPSPGKAPIGAAWGRNRPTEETLRKAWPTYRHGTPSVGLKLGPKGGVIDIDVDAPELAQDALARMFPNGLPATKGWTNAGGRFHLLFRYDARLDRFKTIIKGELQPDGSIKGNEHYLGLEVRINTGDKQVQSVIPPSPLKDGMFRTWNGNPEILPVPDELIADLEANALAKREAGGKRGPFNVKATKGEYGDNRYARASAWLAKLPPSFQGSDGSGALFQAALTGPMFDLTRSETIHLLESEYNVKGRCDPLWSRGEIEHKVDDAFVSNVAIRNGIGWKLREERNGYSGNGHHGENGHSNGKAGTGGTFHEAGVEHAQARPNPDPTPQFTAPPRPLTADLLPVPEFFPELLPVVLRDWILDISQRGCFPIEYPATAAVVSIGSLIGRRLAIRPKRRDDFLAVPNLWGAAVGPPGIQKTPPVEEAMRPLKRLVAEAIDAHEKAITEHNLSLVVETAKKGAAKSALDKAAKDKNTPEDELRRLAAEAIGSKSEEPKAKRYLVNDATVEKLGELLSENPNGLLTFRDELVGFFKTMDKQGHESDRGFHLESWNGLGSFVYDRIGRGTVHIKNVCQSIYGTIQPGPLAKYLKGAASGVEADGLMPRFQVLVYPDIPQTFVNIDRYPNQVARDRAFEVFRWLDKLDPGSMGCMFDDARNTHYIGFADDAQDFFDGWRTDLENRLRGGDENVMMQGHLAKYRSLLPKLALVFHLVDSVGAEQLEPVPLKAIETAAAWCDLLEEHARRIYQSAMDGDSESAMRLADRIKKSIPNPFTFREIVQKGWAGLNNTEAVREAVGFLEDRGWVKIVEVPPGPTGGRPSEKVWIHPHLMARPVDAGSVS